MRAYKNDCSLRSDKQNYSLLKYYILVEGIIPKLRFIYLTEMRIKPILFIIVIELAFASGLSSQTILHPNSTLKSHETLEISKIEITAQRTVVYMSVENRIAGGYFCADKNIYLVDPDGRRIRITTSNGIPVCPDSYKFKAPGEKLSFQLIFPPLAGKPESIDIIEDCSDNCFSIYGICLDNDLNDRIEEAFKLAENGEPASAVVEFVKIADLPESNTAVKGLLYMNIIQLYKETGNTQKATEWYGKLKSSDLRRKELYLTHLNSLGIAY